MRLLLGILALVFLIPSNVTAIDQYYKSKPSWNGTIRIEPNIEVRSIPKIDRRDIKVIKETYQTTKRLFFEYWHVNIDRCSFNQFNIRIIRNHHELSNKKYFPDESEYAEGEWVIFGRYFRSTNTLYVVRPNENKWFWRRDFAHELLHYLFDECRLSSYNEDIEHQKIYQFLEEYKSVFE